MKHIKKSIIIALSFLLLGCTKHLKELDEPISRDFQEHQESPSFKEIKPLKDEWYKKVNLTITKSIPFRDFLRNFSKNFGVRITMDESVKEERIEYKSLDKSLVFAIADICEIYGWKLKINGSCANISIDAPYSQIHSVPFLAMNRSSKSGSSLSGNFSSGKKEFDGSSSASLDSSSSLNSFEELEKIINSLLSNYEKDKEEKQYKFSMHKQAGIMILYAPQKIQKIVHNLLSRLIKNLCAQVLIEARIYQVSLSEKFETGINWNSMIGRLLHPLETLSADHLKNGLAFAFKDPGENKPLGDIAHALRIFGKVESISNPRIIVSNNNTAILKSVHNKVFFELKQQPIGLHNNFGVTTGKGAPEIFPIYKVLSKIQTIPIGIIIFVQPSIDPSGKITIALRPTISQVIDEVEDPAISIMSSAKGNATKSKIPVVDTQEINTVFSAEPDVPIVIGGLIYSRKEKDEKGIPGLNAKFNFFNNSKEKLSEKKEIVILMKAKLSLIASNNAEIIFVE